MTDTPDLDLVDTAEMSRCGAETSDGSPCERETGGDPCWQHSDGSPAGPEPPEHLKSVGRREWNRLVGQLVRAGKLGSLMSDPFFLPVLEQVCEVYESRRAAHKELTERGLSIKSDRGEGTKKNPAAGKFDSYCTKYIDAVKMLRGLVDDAEGSTDDEDVNPFDAPA